jgi:subtilisin family serine protease
MCWSGRVVVGTVLASLMALVMVAPAGAASYPRPRSDEWWFTAWAVQDKLWPITQGAGVTVAVIDTGVQADLPEFSGVVKPGTDTKGGGDGRTDGDSSAVPGHGTGMASLIAAQGGNTSFVGVAPKAKILPVIADDATSIAAGIRYATDKGAKVINISLGGPQQCPDRMQQAVGYAIQHDVVVVASSGDYGDAENSSLSPANCAGVLAVGAVSVSGGKFVPWPKTEQQPYVAVGAPGGNVGAVLKDGQFHTSGGGTSQASALTAGAVALVRAKYPNMSARDVVQRVIASCLDMGDSGKDDTTGYGIIRVYHALTAKVPNSAPNPVFASYDKWRGASTGDAKSSAKPGTGAPSGRRSSAELIVAGLILVVGLIVIVLVVLRLRGRGRRRNGYGQDLRQPNSPGAYGPPGNESPPPSFGPSRDQQPPGDGRPTFRPPNQEPPPGRR